MGAAAKIGSTSVSADSGDGIVAEVEKRGHAGAVDEAECAECKATLSEDGIP